MSSGGGERNGPDLGHHKTIGTLFCTHVIIYKYRHINIKYILINQYNLFIKRVYGTNYVFTL